MTKQEKLTMINNRCAYNMHNGIYVSDFGDDYCVVECDLTPETLNPLGMAHGGFVFSVCDVASGAVVLLRGDTSVTLSGNIQYLRPTKGDKLRCVGRIIKDGRTVVVAETNVYDPEGTLTARGIFELYILEHGSVFGQPVK